MFNVKNTIIAVLTLVGLAAVVAGTVKWLEKH